MAKRNDGLQYFPFDVVMEETYALIEAQFGICGFAILVKLMQKIYGERGYYCDWQEENALLFSHKIGQDNQLVCKVVDAAVKRGIFDREMFRRYHILTSKSIQKIYFEATSRRRETYADSRFLLLTEEELPKNVNINGKNVNTNANNVDTNAKNDDTKQQSKVKERKVKQQLRTPGLPRILCACLNKSVLALTAPLRKLQEKISKRHRKTELISRSCSGALNARTFCPAEAANGGVRSTGL